MLKQQNSTTLQLETTQLQPQLEMKQNLILVVVQLTVVPKLVQLEPLEEKCGDCQ